jgi:hypothetical protein
MPMAGSKNAAVHPTGCVAAPEEPPGLRGAHTRVVQCLLLTAGRNAPLQLWESDSEWE